MKEYYVDYRFVVKAKDRYEAGLKVLDFLPDSTDDIWYTINAIHLSKKVKVGGPAAAYVLPSANPEEEPPSGN